MQVTSRTIPRHSSQPVSLSMGVRRMSNARLVPSRRPMHRHPRLRCPSGFLLPSKYRPRRLPAGQIIPMEAVRWCHTRLVQLMVYMGRVLQHHRNWLTARPLDLRCLTALRTLRETRLLRLVWVRYLRARTPVDRKGPPTYRNPPVAPHRPPTTNYLQNLQHTPPPPRISLQNGPVSLVPLLGGPSQHHQGSNRPAGQTP